MKNIIIATNNLGKLKEYQEMLEPLNYKCISLRELGFSGDIEENGSTFKENSYIKAKAIFDLYQLPVIADDSGLSVDVLGGEPGIHSHRYANENATDEENIDYLISNLKRKNPPYSARFICSITYIDKVRIIQEEGFLSGEIVLKRAGYDGFGYDPLFYVKEYNKTVAELGDEIKNQISHRHNALTKIIKALGE